MRRTFFMSGVSVLLAILAIAAVCRGYKSAKGGPCVAPPPTAPQSPPLPPTAPQYPSPRDWPPASTPPPEATPPVSEVKKPTEAPTVDEVLDQLDSLLSK